MLEAIDTVGYCSTADDADLVWVFRVHEDLLIFFKPRIHGPELNVKKAQQGSLVIPFGGATRYFIAYFDSVFLVLASVTFGVKVVISYVAFEEVIWIIWFQPSVNMVKSLVSMRTRLGPSKVTHTSLGERVSTMYFPPKRTRTRFWQSSI